MAHHHSIPRPGPIDGLDVIAGYGNRPGVDLDTGRIVGRLGQNWITCRDGFTVSVVAGHGFHGLPDPSMIPDLQLLGHAPFDYRGPYTHFEVYGPSARPEPWDAWSRHFCEGSPHWEGPYMYVPLGTVRALLDLHGGFHRFRRIRLLDTAQADLIRLAKKTSKFQDEDQSNPEGRLPCA